MDSKILEFASLLRQAGVKVSNSEVSETLQALALTDLDREPVYNCMSATMVKDQADFPVFDKLFYYYFDGDFFGHREGLSRRWPDLIRNIPEGQGCGGADGTCLSARESDGPDAGQEKGRATGFGQGQGLASAPVDNFINIIKVGNQADMTAMVMKGIESLGPITKEDLTNMEEAVRQVKVFLEWNMGIYRLEQEAREINEMAWLTWQERLLDLEEILYRELEKALIDALGQPALETILVRENLQELDFFRLSAPQVSEIKKKIGKMAHRLASRLSFRYKRARRGRVDLPRTIRRSMATGGVPIKPAFKDKYPTRPEIAVLCDLSGSVRLFSEFMLQLVYSIQNRFIHVSSFAFVDTVDEITEFMRNREIEDGIRDIYNKARYFKTPFSDYGLTFKEFWDRFRERTTKKTTLIIIGDARNNYQKDQAEYLSMLKGEVKKIIWLNPQPAEEWNREDSIIGLYSRYCDQVFECRNLQQLDFVTRKII